MEKQIEGNTEDVRENRYYDWSIYHHIEANLFGVHIWTDGTNGCYWVGRDTFHQGVEFQILRRALQWCDFWDFKILSKPQPSALLKNKQWLRKLLDNDPHTLQTYYEHRISENKKVPR